MTLLFTILLLINFIVTYKLLKDDVYEKRQKTIQIFIIWLLPVIGALVVFLFLHRESKNKNNPYGGSKSNDFYESSGYSGGD